MVGEPVSKVAFEDNKTVTYLWTESGRLLVEDLYYGGIHMGIITNTPSTISSHKWCQGCSPSFMVFTPL